MNNNFDKAEALAKSPDFPGWATHVAVRRDGSKIEPAVYDLNSSEYLDEELDLTEKWQSCFSNKYWEFFGIVEMRCSMM